MNNELAKVELASLKIGGQETEIEDDGFLERKSARFFRTDGGENEKNGLKWR